MLTCREIVRILCKVRVVRKSLVRNDGLANFGIATRILIGFGWAFPNNRSMVRIFHVEENVRSSGQRGDLGVLNLVVSVGSMCSS